MSKKLGTKIHESYVNIFVATTVKIAAGIVDIRHSFLEAFDFWFDGEIVLA
jgi:hypothetical protein